MKMLRLFIEDSLFHAVDELRFQGKIIQSLSPILFNQKEEEQRDQEGGEDATRNNNSVINPFDVIRL